MRYLQKLAESSFKIVYLSGLRNSVADALSRQPGELGQLNDGNIGDSGSRARVLQDPVVFFGC